MRLAIREYLSLLREAGELDAVVGDLLLMMGLSVIVRPQVGTRQFGVDLAAVGADPTTRETTGFLLVIKRGDIGRSEWHGGPQAVRQSMEEAIEIFLPREFRPRHPGILVRVILCCSGEIRQEVQPNWTGFVEAHRGDGLEFEAWTGDTLSGLIEKYFLSEFLFPAASRDDIRRTLALIGANEYDLQDFREFLDRTYSSEMRAEGSDKISLTDSLRIMRLVILALRIVTAWGGARDNLEPSFRACELALLRSWDWLRRERLLENRLILREFGKLYCVYEAVGIGFCQKLKPLRGVRDSLFGYGPEFVEYPLQTFYVIGLLATFGLTQLDFDKVDPEAKGRARIAREVADFLVEIIHNNPAARAPSFDGHGIELNAAIELLVRVDCREEALEWIRETFARVIFAYRLQQHFPIATDSYEDLVDFHFGEVKDITSLTRSSTLVPVLVEWAAGLEDAELYSEMVEVLGEVLKDTTIQVWYPDGATEDLLYSENASHSGVTDAPITYPESAEELRSRLLRLQAALGEVQELSCVKANLPSLAAVASRHFRSPIYAGYRHARLLGQNTV